MTYCSDNITKRIFEICKSKGVSGKQLGAILGLTKSPLTDWKNKASKPTLEHIITIMNHFDLEPNELFSARPESVMVAEDSVKYHVNNTSFEKHKINMNDTVEIISEGVKSSVKEYLSKIFLEDSIDRKSKDISVQNCDDENEKIVSLEEYTKLPMKGYVAAGEPIDLPDEYSMTDIVSLPKNGASERADFALKVKGDSMEPLIEDGEIVLVKMQPDSYNGQIVVASIDNTATLKKIYRYPDRIELHSINPKYPPIKISSEFTDFRIIGVRL